MIVAQSIHTELPLGLIKNVLKTIRLNVSCIIKSEVDNQNGCVHGRRWKERLYGKKKNSPHFKISPKLNRVNIIGFGIGPFFICFVLF